MPRDRGAGEDPPVIVARAEFQEKPEPPVAQWFLDNGVEVRTPLT